MYDVLIVGCGVIGAATAYKLSRYNLKVAIAERYNDVACGTTKANSAIMHAGYDPEPGTKKAILNRRGIEQAREVVKKLDVEYRPLQSLVIAFNDRDMEEIRKLYTRGLENGVHVKILSQDEAHAVEPALNPNVIGALWSDDSAIINPWEFATAMAEVAVVNGADLRLNAEVYSIEQHEDYLTAVTANGKVDAKFIINAAGCYAPDIAKMVGDDRIEATNRAGQYYVLDKVEGRKVNSVIFGCPDENGFKGVLVSPTVHGNLLVGPDAEIAAHPEDLATKPDNLGKIRAAGLKYVPTINYRNMIREYAGVRPTTNFGDFIIEINPCCSRMINLAGMASPGLSSALAVGDEAVKLLADSGLEMIENPDFKDERPPVIRFKELSPEEKKAVIEKNPAYGQIICRCETVTEGEIVDALHRPIVPVSVDGVKRRCRAGMGRCQGGFCSPRVHEIISRELGIPEEKVQKDKQGSYIITGRTK